MARIRCIKPEFAQSQSMGQVSRDARLLFIQLWTQCDDHGKARASPRMLASLLFPYDDDAAALIEGWLAELEREGCIERYVAAGAHYLRIVNWHHQKIDRPSPSRFPGPVEPSRGLDDSPPRIREGIKEGIEEGSGRAHALPQGWTPQEDDIAWAAGARPDLDRAALDAETERFRLHASANARTAHRWGPSWRLWVSKAHAHVREERKETASPAVDESDLQWRARLKSYRPGRFWLEGDWGPRPEAQGTRVPAALLAEWRERQRGTPADA